MCQQQRLKNFISASPLSVDELIIKAAILPLKVKPNTCVSIMLFRPWFFLTTPAFAQLIPPKHSASICAIAHDGLRSLFEASLAVSVFAVKDIFLLGFSDVPIKTFNLHTQDC